MESPGQLFRIVSDQNIETDTFIDASYVNPSNNPSVPTFHVSGNCVNRGGIDTAADHFGLLCNNPSQIPPEEGQA
jgi:hypothetical protein